MTLADRLDHLESRIQAACASVGRPRDSVTLIAVSKTVPIETIAEAYGLGLRDFGESKLQEALPKIEALPKDIRWHFIGKLQSNKARRAAQACQVIHTLESEAQLKEMSKITGTVDGLIEVNIGEEPQKSGVLPGELDRFWARTLDCLAIRLRGLMAIGPDTEDLEQTRRLFAQMRLLNERLGGQWLSIGMSGDFEVAIQEGASHVRVGTALFGARR